MVGVKGVRTWIGGEEGERRAPTATAVPGRKIMVSAAMVFIAELSLPAAFARPVVIFASLSAMKL